MELGSGVLDGDTRVLEDDTGGMELGSGLLDGDTRVLEDDTGGMELGSGVLDGDTRVLEDDTGGMELGSGVFERSAFERVVVFWQGEDDFCHRERVFFVTDGAVTTWGKVYFKWGNVYLMLHGEECLRERWF